MTEGTLDTQLALIKQSVQQQDKELEQIKHDFTTEIEKVNKKLDDMNRMVLVLLSSTVASLILLVLNIVIGKFAK